VRRGLGIVLALTALGWAGCGGTSKTPVAGGSATTSSTSSSSQGGPGSVSKASLPAGRDIVKTGEHHVSSARGIGTEPNDEVNSSGAKKINPCMLVTRSQAQAILGKPVGALTEAPQGPTCIYRPRGAKSFITLAVESKNFSKVEPQSQLRDRISLKVAGHSAYCGVVGTPMLIVSLANGKFMSVAAPCPIAASFAAKALARLPG
jgi:hypothetical protein